MEALSHISKGAEIRVGRNTAVLRGDKDSADRQASQGSALQGAPSVTLPFRFVIVGLLSLFTGLGWLAARPVLLTTYHYNQSIIALTHLFVLGWICSVVMGAMYQLVPVALETKLYSERLSRWQFLFHITGVGGMVWMFQAWNMKLVGHFGSVFAVGVGLFVYNIARTLARVPRWNVIASAIAAALGWLCLGVLAGLSLAATKCVYQMTDSVAPGGFSASILKTLRPLAGFVSRFDAISAMHAHAHLGAIGFFTMLIVGVSYKLVPMFTLSELQSPARAAWSVGLLNAGLAGSFLSILLRAPWKIASALTIVIALGIYGFEMVAILRARKRRVPDWGVKMFLTAVVLLAPLSAAGLVLSIPGLPLTSFTGQLETVYGFVGFLGVISLGIIGMLYKIVPFLVWFGVYSRHIGRAQIPSLADLYCHRLQALGYWTYLSGLLVTSLACLAVNAAGVRWGCLLIGASLLCLATNIVHMLIHFWRPKLKPLDSPQRPKTPLNSRASFVHGSVDARGGLPAGNTSV